MPAPNSTTCPDCEKDEHVTGRVDEQAGDVELTCGRCGRSWWRGERCCASCGGQDLTIRPQVMHRHSRGNQLSIMGWRDVTLCHECDADLLDTLGSGHTPIPEDYVSSALIDVNATPTPPASRTADRPRTAPPAQLAAQSALGSAPPRPPQVPPSPRRPATVRQAVERSQTLLAARGESLDPTVLLLLGQRLGPATRLEQLATAGHDPASVRAWAEHLWGAGAGWATARHTITALADHWQRQGWTATDMAAELRPQEDT